MSRGLMNLKAMILLALALAACTGGIRFDSPIIFPDRSCHTCQTDDKYGS